LDIRREYAKKLEQVSFAHFQLRLWLRS
jgi:hypothetical protein